MDAIIVALLVSIGLALVQIIVILDRIRAVAECDRAAKIPTYLKRISRATATVAAVFEEPERPEDLTGQDLVHR